MEIALDEIDRKLLNLIQVEFPLSREPFSVLGQRLGVNGEQVIRRIERLKAEGVIRQIGPLFDARSLGYQTTLVAVRVEESQLDRAAQLISEHPGVSHCYQRDNSFNLWFTLALPIEEDIKSELGRLQSLTGADVILDLPALRVFKLGAYFDMNGDSSAIGRGVRNDSTLPQSHVLSSTDRRVVNELQKNELTLIQRPFEAMSAHLGMNVDDLLTQCRLLIERGIMRRFGASIRHRNVGFVANAMVCWIALPDMVEAAGRMLANLPEVSHCYERKTNPLWLYNLFAMIHGFTREKCQEIADTVSHETGLKDSVSLFSIKEFKKVRVRYSV